MRVIIAGGRDLLYGYEPIVAQAIKDSGFDITEIVCGGAKGIDSIGAAYGDFNKIPVKYFHADWNKHGKAAGPIRNLEMAENADALILVWDGKSAGSSNMKTHAIYHGLKIHEVVVCKHWCDDTDANTSMAEVMGAPRKCSKCRVMYT